MSAQSDIPQAKRPKKGCNMKVASSLKHNLRQANILDDDIGNIDEKLTQRLSANVISYLQLCVLKVSPNASVHQQNQLAAHQKRNEYAEAVSDYVSSINISCVVLAKNSAEGGVQPRFLAL